MVATKRTKLGSCRWYFAFRSFSIEMGRPRYVRLSRHPDSNQTADIIGSFVPRTNIP
jgi:hypothetical protein